MSETPRTRTTIALKLVPFRSRSAPLSVARLERIPPLCTSRVFRIQIWHGIIDPADADEFELWLLATDVQALPDASSARRRSIWGMAQAWTRDVGGVLTQTIEHEDVPILGGAVDNVELADRTRDNNWVLAAFVDSGTLTTHTVGVLTVQHTYFDRIWGDDSYTWINDPGSVNRDGVSEIDMDIYG